MSIQTAKHMRVFLNGDDISGRVCGLRFEAVPHAACKVYLELYAVPMILPNADGSHDIVIDLLRPAQLPTADMPRAIRLRAEVDEAEPA